jgi:RNA recognition motif. (a.k.a. RRM, RBD, or RNP domain)
MAGKSESNQRPVLTIALISFFFLSFLLLPRISLLSGVEGVFVGAAVRSHIALSLALSWCWLTSPKDLFNVQIGKVQRVTLAYGPQGVSKGIATIQFINKGDAKKAYDKYDGKLIDNTRRLKVNFTLPSLNALFVSRNLSVD